jgi:hypothetical protein
VSLLVPANKSLSGPVPAPEESSHDVDHFLCYGARATRRLPDGAPLPRFQRGIQVEVADQFQTRRYDLKRIDKYCAPVAKSGAPLFLVGENKGLPKTITPALIRNPDTHLVCYRAKLARKTITQVGCGPLNPANPDGLPIEPMQQRHQRLTGIHVNNQFGPEQLDTSGEIELCLPATRVEE